MRTLTLFTFLFGLVSLQGQDTLTLFECHKKAVEHAPRMQDKERIRQIGSLKIANAEAGWLPSMILSGKASYQSDVVTLSLEDSPVPIAFPEVPHDQYGLNLDISQTLYDGGMIQRKRTYEMAAADADLQQVEVDLHGLKEQVNNLFFSILLVQENLNNLDIHIDNLNTRREVMEAGIEHLGRATASAVDKLIVVVEPGRRSIDTAGHIHKLASEIGLKNIAVVGNKIRGKKDEAFLQKHLNDLEIIGFIPYDDTLIEADLDGVSPFDVDTAAKTNINEMISRLQ